MPPKDMQPRELLFSADNGETYKPIGRLAEDSLIVDDLIPEGEVELPLCKPNDEMVISCKFNIKSNPSLFMFLWTGKWPSNNWLKMHGHPMRRKRKHEKR